MVKNLTVFMLLRQCQFLPVSVVAMLYRSSVALLCGMPCDAILLPCA